MGVWESFHGRKTKTARMCVLPRPHCAPAALHQSLVHSCHESMRSSGWLLHKHHAQQNAIVFRVCAEIAVPLAAALKHFTICDLAPPIDRHTGIIDSTKSLTQLLIYAFICRAFACKSSCSSSALPFLWLSWQNLSPSRSTSHCLKSQQKKWFVTQSHVCLFLSANPTNSSLFRSPKELRIKKLNLKQKLQCKSEI